MSVSLAADLAQTAVVTVYYVALAGLSAYGLHRFWMLYLYYRHRHDRPRPPSHWHELPFVTVQLPLYNERFVAERLLEAVARFDYPRDRLQIQVLDDSTDDTRAILERKVNDLKAAGGNIQLLHRTSREGFKAGALRDAMPYATGEFIAIYDADFLPPPDALRTMIHHFTDPRVGLVQTRWSHLNETQSPLTRAQGILLDGHFLIEHTARSRAGRFINFNGTGGMWRRMCIEQAGGWNSESLTEDIDLSYRAQLAGWRFVYLPEVTTPGELPADINAYKQQQHRWTKGTAQTARRLLPRLWRSRLPLPVKWEATVRLTSNLCYPLMLALCVTGPLRIVLAPEFGRGRWFDAGVFIAATLSVLSFYMVAQKELRRDWWRQLLHLPALIVTGIGLCLNNARAVLEGWAGPPGEFVRTPKMGTSAMPTPAAAPPLRAYRSWRGRMPSLELAMGGYLTLMILVLAGLDKWLSILFVLPFLIGFLGVGIASLIGIRWGLAGWVYPIPSRAHRNVLVEETI